MTNILITGVNGYIGLKIATHLVEVGNEIIGIDINSSNVKSLINKPNFKFFRADITDTVSFPAEVQQVDIVIHCAALVHKRSKDLSRENYFKINCQGTKNILSFLNKRRLKQIIFLSTVTGYGSLAQEMIPDENTPLAPEDFYSESKMAAENEIREFSKNNSIPFTILRLAPVYGKKFLLNINKRVYLPKKMAFYKIASGEQRISLCSVHNLIDIIAHCLNKQSYFNETYIIKDTKDYSVNEIICVFKEVFAQKNKPIIRIPSLIPEIVFGCIGLIMPRKGKFYKYQLKKIAQDSICSGNKIYSSGIRLKWNLKSTLSESN